MPRGVPNAKAEKPDEAPDVEAPEVEQEAIEHRYETFEATRPDGVVVIVERNVDTGDQTVTEK